MRIATVWLSVVDRDRLRRIRDYLTLRDGKTASASDALREALRATADAIGRVETEKVPTKIPA